MLAFATFPGWTETLQTLALFLSLDAIAAYFVEPVVLGQRTGVSSFALLVSALFWIWVWGPAGLLLATPLTVCIAVLGRHVRSLRFLAIIFADEPALTPHVRFYQRLLARDEDEASALVERKLNELGPIGLIDHVLIPAVALVIQHRPQDEISEEDAGFILDVIAETVQQMSLATSKESGRKSSSIVGLAARTPVDQVVLEMLRAALGADRIESISAEFSSEQAMLQVIEQKPALVCVVAISPTRGSEVRNYCRRIRRELPQTKVLVLRPHLADADISKSAARMKDAGADCVVTSTRDAVQAMGTLLPEARPEVETSPPRIEHSEDQPQGSPLAIAH